MFVVVVDVCGGHILVESTAVCYTYIKKITQRQTSATKRGGSAKYFGGRGNPGTQSYPDVPAKLEVGTPIFAKGETSGKGPYEFKGQPVAAIECVSFDPT